jgi:CubicO group peptidase (beta-lactamase class C family)
MRAPTLIAASLIALLPATASAYDPPASLKAQLATAPDFSGVILVDVGDGKPFVWTQGPARGDRPITPGTRFDIGSIGKLITATAVMQLVEQGKIDLDAPIGRYLPEFAAPARDKVTVAMLLNHTGGLDEILFAPQFRDRSRAARDNHEVYLLSAAQPNAAAGGGQARYSNTGFIVLGEIVARASGAPYEAHIRKAILEPAGMIGAVFMRSDSVDAPDIAMGYLRADADPRPGPPAGPPARRRPAPILRSRPRSTASSPTGPAAYMPPPGTWRRSAGRSPTASSSPRVRLPGCARPCAPKVPASPMATAVWLAVATVWSGTKADVLAWRASC